ncbi:MAG: hemolysin III family protein [Acidimicrobiia bacterium]
MRDLHEPLDVPLGSPNRPVWRGRLHLLALGLAVPLIALLGSIAAGARVRAAVIVHGAGLCSMLAVSTTYHRWVHSQRWRAVLRRADHAVIFAAIAGTCSAVALLCLDTVAAIAFLIVIWTAAAIGALLKLVAFDRVHRSGVALYVVLGWSGAALVPAAWNRGGWLVLGLLLAGGITYTVGAMAFHRRWPTLRPETFSYHEVWHAATIVAAGLHLTAITVLAH